MLILESVDNEYMDIIKALVGKIRVDYGLKVDLFCTDLEVAGRIHYDKKLIEINEPTAKGAFMTLCHEIGHWIGYLENGEKPQDSYTVEEREEWAKTYGWAMIRTINADMGSENGLISKKEWMELHASEDNQ